MFQRSGGIVVATVLLYNRLAALASLAPRQTGPVNILHPQANLSKCIDVSDGFLANGSEVRVFDCNDTPAQNWIIQQGPTTVQLNGTNLCLDAGNNPGNNVQILVLDCIAGRQAQQWNYTIDHDIILNGTDLCLDLMDGDPTNPNQLQISSCSNAETNQIWVEGPPGNGSTTPPPPPTGAPPPPQDLLVRTLHPNASSTKCVDVRDGNFANNTAVQVFDCNNTPAQNWIIERNSTKIQLNGTDFCLDAGSSPADGVQLKIFTCIADLPAQQWNYTIDNEIILNGTDLCLDLTGGVLTNSNQLQISNCSNADTNQIWVEDAPGNGTTTPSPPPTQSPPPVTNVTSVGTLHPIANAKKCIDVRGNGRANGTPVQVFDCNGTPAQNWVIQQGLTKVQLNGTNVCLDAGSKPANGVKMKIWECFEGLPAQQWRFTNDHLVFDGTGFCLDLTDGVLANSNQLQIWTCGRGNNNQVWSEGLPGNGTSTQPPPSPATVDTLHPIASSGKCIDVRGNGRANGTPVQVFDCNDTPAQNWKVQRGSTKVQLNGTNVCLDAGSKPAKGIKMKIWECFDGLAAQQWHYTDDNQLILEGTDFCLDLTDGGLANSNQLQTWTCGTGNKNQIWLEGPPGNGTSVPPPAPKGRPLHRNGNRSKCLDVRGAILANGTPVQIFDCNGSNAQNWIFNDGNTKVQLAGTDFCLDATSGDPASGTKMKIWKCFDNLPAQAWTYSSSHTLKLQSANECLDLTNGVTTNSNQLQVWQCFKGNTNQIWTV